jgi:NAD(P)-dependent dehydrogenase (short-subunit alcohol dehydrogenase family)
VGDNVAIVTGGAGDLGRGVCRALTKAGAEVVVLDIDPGSADSADLVLDCDVTDADACSAAVDEVVRRYGGVSTLVNMAQQWNHVTLMEVTDEEMLLTYRSGPMATLRMMRLCYPHMDAAGGGSVVNFASASGTQGGVYGEGAYAAAKEAIRGLTKHAAVEWGPDNIRVNAVCPVATGDPQRWGPSVAEVIPMKRLGDPEIDVGGLVVFLAGPNGTFITGRTIHVDGGVGTWR